jgi:hypothetical protein
MICILTFFSKFDANSIKSEILNELNEFSR